jgi:hypothetical protein
MLIQVFASCVLQALAKLAGPDPEFKFTSPQPTAGRRVARARKFLPKAKEIYEQKWGKERVGEAEDQGKAEA